MRPLRDPVSQEGKALRSALIDDWGGVANYMIDAILCGRHEQAVDVLGALDREGAIKDRPSVTHKGRVAAWRRICEARIDGAPVPRSMVRLVEKVYKKMLDWDSRYSYDYSLDPTGMLRIAMLRAQFLGQCPFALPNCLIRCGSTPGTSTASTPMREKRSVSVPSKRDARLKGEKCRSSSRPEPGGGTRAALARPVPRHLGG